MIPRNDKSARDHPRTTRGRRKRAIRRLRLDFSLDVFQVGSRLRRFLERHHRVWRFARLVIAFGIGVGIGVWSARLYQRRVMQRPIVAVNGIGLPREQLLTNLEQTYGSILVRRFANVELRTQFARATRTLPSDSEVDARLAAEEKRPGFSAQLASSGATIEQYRERLKLSMALFRHVTRGVLVSEADARMRYERDIDPKNPRSEYRIPETATIAAIAARNQSEAQAAFEAVRRGESWESVARRVSLDPTAERGGLQPPLIRGRNRSPYSARIEQFVFSSAPGAMSGPIEAGPLWWIIQVRDRSREVVLPYEVVKEDARMAAMLSRAGPAAMKKTLAEYRAWSAKARVQTFSPRYGAIQLTK